MTNSSSNSQNFFLVAIGASAGGVQALESFFSNLPDQPNAAFIVVQHLSPDFRSMMAQILQRKTVMTVRSIEDGMEIEPGYVYVLPQKKHLVVSDRRLCLLDSPESFDYPINKFFRSLVKGWEEKMIAILLSGTGNDGTEGIQAISRAGGIGLVQSPETAQFNSMPSSAIPSGLVDEILSPQELAQTVSELIRFSDNFPNASSEEAVLIDPEQLQTILNVLADREEIDFSHYKISTLSRRIHHRCALTHCENLKEYIDLLEDSEEEQKLLRRDLLIGVTQFFRDTAAWEFLETKALPELIEQLQPSQQMRVWVSACATGEEAYSMAILLDEAIAKSNKEIQVKIFATDLDTEALEITAEGIYPESIRRDISAERLEKYFTFTGEHFQVKRFLREMLIVAPQDLTKNAGFSKMNLVSCRNVLIYMQPQLQQQVLRLLHFALAPQGMLFLGGSETLGDLAEEFSIVHSKWKMFRKRRDVTLSIGQIARQTMVAKLPGLNRGKSKSNQQLDRLLKGVFRYCLNERQLTCLLVDRDNLLVRVFYNAAQLLEFPIGEAMLDVVEIVNSELKLPLSTALHRARRDRQPVLYTGIKVNRQGENLNITLRVGAETESSSLEDYLIVVLEVEAPTVSAPVAMRFDLDEEAAQQITELEYELQQTRENLQVTIEELEATNEEQQATNEELLASNEELQSINEELQSVNEELYTVNAEHQSKIAELTQLNNDINNLLRSTDIGVVFLDSRLNIRKFTPAATEAINIKPNDLGRPLADITNNLSLNDLSEVLQQVIDSELPLEREVSLVKTGVQLLMRINLYLREDGQNDGVVVTFVKVDELKRTQEKLRGANSLLENLYSTSPAGLSLHDSNLRYLRLNQALAEINGLSVKEHIGKTTREVIPDFADLIEPVLRQVIETGRPVCNVEMSGSTSANPNMISYWNASFYPVDLLDGNRGVGSVVMEISDRIEAEANLRASEAKLLEAQKLANIGNWEINIQDEFEIGSAKAIWSAQLYAIYGLDSQQPVPTFDELIQFHPTEDQTLIREAFRQLIEHSTPFNLDLRCNCPDGEVRYLNSIGRAACDSKEKIVKLYGTVIDITERKQIEAELMRQNRALEEAIAVAQAADSANQAKSDFLANMSHEIRTPMNAILAVGQLLDLSDLNAEQRSLLQTLKANGTRLLTLIDDILDLSKIEARELKINPNPFEMKTVGQNLWESFRPQTQAKGLELNLTISDELPDYFIGDDFRLSQVLNNLVSNALKFTERGQIAIKIEPQSKTSEDLWVVRFTVQDTGIGIPQQQQQMLFQAFTQADSSTTRQYGGTGLGLTISRRIVELMGGELGVASVVDEGSTFWFTLPLEVAEGVETVNPSEANPSLPLKAQDNSAQAKRLLIVDDNLDNRDLLFMMLQPLGYEIERVSNGQEALESLASGEYDLILMDCQMPVLDGYQTTQIIRRREGKQRHTVIIGLTGNVMQGDRQKCLDAGMDDYVSKPVDLKNLTTVIQQWLEK